MPTRIVGEAGAEAPGEAGSRRDRCQPSEGTADATFRPFLFFVVCKVGFAARWISPAWMFGRDRRELKRNERPVHT